MMRIVVITVRGLHLGYLGCYGNDWVATPHLDRLAAEGVVFDRHVADCPGADPCGSWSGSYRFPQPPANSTPEIGKQNLLAGALKEHAIPLSVLTDSKPTRKVDPIGRAIQRALAELDTLAAEPRWLLWLDLPSLAPPWRVPEEMLEAYFVEAPEDEEDEEREPLLPWLDPPVGSLEATDDATWDRLQFTYAALVSHLDEQLGGLFDGVRHRFPADDVLVCFTADCGLPLGEHGSVGWARPWLHEELVHVPLLMHLPGGAEAGRRMDALTQPVDLLPTLLDAFGIPIPPLHGHSLLPLVRGEIHPVRPYACSGLRTDDALEWAIRTPEWAFLLPLQVAPGAARGAQLYAKPDDRWEVNNVIQHHLELAERLERALRAFIAASEVGGPFMPPEV